MVRGSGGNSKSDSPNEDSDESDFDFDYGKLADDLNELQISDKYLNEDEMEIDSTSESYIGNGGFTSVSLKDITPISVFRSFFTEEILNLITDQTNIYGKQKTQRNSQNKTDRWKDVETKGVSVISPIVNFANGIFAIGEFLHEVRQLANY
jgi:hypothetical protein